MEPASQPQSAVTWVLQHSQHKRNTGYVLIKLAQCMDAGNNCPSHKDLADMTGLSKSTIQGALGELEKDGTIERTKNGGAKVRGGYTTCYRLAGHTPVTSKGTPPESKPVESVQDKSVSDESTPKPSGDKHEETPTHTHAAGEKASVSPEKKKDRQTDSLKPKDTREPEDDGLTPEERGVRDGFGGVFGMMDESILTELRGYVSYYSHIFVSVVIGNARAKIENGGTIDRPMGYIRTALANMAAEGKIPHLVPLNPSVSKFNPNAPAPVSRSPSSREIQERQHLPREEWVDIDRVMADAPKRRVHV